MSGNEFAQYAADLARVADSLEERADAISEHVALGALDTALEDVPVDKGNLKRSGKVRRRGSVYSVEFDDEAAPWQEYGTSSQPAQPFIGPAVDEWGPRLVQELEGLRDDVIEELG